MRYNTALFHHFRPSLLCDHCSLSHRSRLSLAIHDLHPRDREAVDLTERNIADSSISEVMTKMVAVTRGYHWPMMKHQMNCLVLAYWHHGLTRVASELKKNKTNLKWDDPKSIKNSFQHVYRRPPTLTKIFPIFSERRGVSVHRLNLLSFFMILLSHCHIIQESWRWNISFKLFVYDVNSVIYLFLN